MYTRATRLSLLLVATAAASAVLATMASPPVYADILSVSGQVKVIDTPPSRSKAPWKRTISSARLSSERGYS
jgi:hypothetical protein